MASLREFPDFRDSELSGAWSDPLWTSKFPPVLTVNQAAELLQVPKATVYDWSSRGLLKGCSRRMGKHLRFWRDRLLKHVFQNGVNSVDV
jgi:excisionase family DNA binding protein